jgi:type IV pilus assembly protein PilX
MDRQRGIALVVSLVLLIMVMLLGVSAAQLSLQGEKAARSERDRNVAFLAAEDALKDAEHDIDDSSDPARRAALPPATDSPRSAPAAAGLRARAPAGDAGVAAVDLSGVEDGGGCTAMHGAYTGAAMPTGEGFLPFKKPRYLIERMACHQPGDDAAASAPPHYCYRVTAIGFGSSRRPKWCCKAYSANRRRHHEQYVARAGAGRGHSPASPRRSAGTGDRQLAVAATCKPTVPGDCEWRRAAAFRRRSRRAQAIVSGHNEHCRLGRTFLALRAVSRCRHDVHSGMGCWRHPDRRPRPRPEPRRSVARSTLHWCSRMAHWQWCPSHGPRCRRAAGIAQALKMIRRAACGYLRGDRSLEGMPFRRRSSMLGDAVHSTPVYVDTPDHRAAIYLGANDGMLHAFDAAASNCSPTCRMP